MPITGVNWIKLSAGFQVCSSGFSTGQICGYRVYGHRDNVNVLNHLTSYMTAICLFDSNGHPHVGFRSGDSGGPIYYPNSNGYAVAGLATAYDESLQGCNLFTRLEGVKKWNSTVRLPG